MPPLSQNLIAILTKSRLVDRVLLTSFKAPLYFLIEIKNPWYPSSALAQNIIDTTQKVYEEGISTPEQNFEQAIKEVNTNLSRAVESGQTEWVENITAIIALIHENKIQLASIGKGGCFLFREGNLIEITKDQPKTAQPLKPFPHILSGQLQNQDKIIIGNADFFNYFSLNFLRQTLTKNKASITRILTNSLIKDRVKTANCLILELSEKASPPLISYLDEKKRFAFLITLLKAIGQLLSKSARLFLKAVKFISKKSIPFLKATGKKLYLKIPFDSLTKPFRQLSSRITLTQKQKKLILFVGLGVVTCLILGILISVIIGNRQTALNISAKQAIIQAEDKTRQADILSANGDEKNAKKLLYEALSLIEQIKGKSADNLREKINQQLDRINKVARPKLSPFFDFGKHFDKPVLSQIFVIDGLPYSIDLENNKIYKKEDNPANLPQYSGRFVCGAYQSQENKIIIYQDKEGIYEYSISDGKVEKATNIFDEKWKKAKAMATYFTNIYLLNPDDGQIYKYEKTTAGYSKAIPYIKDSKVDIKNGISLAVDGYVYVLRSDGTITKFIGGRKAPDFEIKEIPEPDNQIKEPLKIFTWSEIPNLYVLEKNRILEFDKTGKYLRMFVFELKNVKDFWVSFKNKKIYLLSENTVYEIRM